MPLSWFGPILTWFTSFHHSLSSLDVSRSCRRRGQRMDDCSSVGITTLDGHPSSDADWGALGHQKAEEGPSAPIDGRGTSNHAANQADGLSVVWWQLWEQGVSEAAMDSIMASWRWLQFCSKWTISSFNLSVTDILNFLSKTFHRRVGYNSINTVRGALAALGIVLEGCRVGNHLLIKWFLRGVFDLRPSFPRYAETRDVKPVLQKLRTMGPLHELSLKALTL